MTTMDAPASDQSATDSPLTSLPTATLPLWELVPAEYQHYFNHQPAEFFRRSFEFGSSPRLLPLARAFLDTCAAGQGVDDYQYVFTLLGSELATNALQHSRSGRPRGCEVKSHQCPRVKRPCPQECRGHARECPERAGGDFYFARRKGVKEDTPLEEFVLPVPLPVVRELRTHWRSQQREKTVAGPAWDDSWDLVFCRPDGQPLGKRADWADWKQVLRIAGVRDARVHDGRHTAGTLLSALGVDPRTIQQILGHSQMSQTARYIHASNELTRGAVDRMGDALWG